MEPKDSETALAEAKELEEEEETGGSTGNSAQRVSGQYVQGAGVALNWRRDAHPLMLKARNMESTE